MHDERSPKEVLGLMLSEILHEAELIRPHDPVKARHLDDAANDLRTVLAERDRDHGRHSPAA
jgi:hypothetical protein